MDSTDTFARLCHLCIHTADVNLLESMFSQVMNINDIDINGHSPTYYAATQNPHIEVLEALIQRGAFLDLFLVEESVKHNQNPHVAIRIFKEIQHPTKAQMNYLFLLSAAHRTEKTLPEFFLEEGASVDATLGLDIYPEFDWDDEPDEQLPSYLLVEENALVFAIYENPDPYLMVPILLELGVDFNFMDREGHSVLYHALDDIELVTLLVEAGCDLHRCDASERTPLMLACEGENCEVARYLIEHDDEINRTCCEGRTPLHFALSLHFTQNHEVVKALLDKGADISARDTRGHTPLDYAYRYYARQETIDLLKKVEEKTSS